MAVILTLGPTSRQFKPCLVRLYGALSSRFFKNYYSTLYWLKILIWIMDADLNIITAAVLRKFSTKEFMFR